MDAKGRTGLWPTSKQRPNEADRRCNWGTHKWSPLRCILVWATPWITYRIQFAFSCLKQQTCFVTIKITGHYFTTREALLKDDVKVNETTAALCSIVLFFRDTNYKNTVLLRIDRLNKWQKKLKENMSNVKDYKFNCRFLNIFNS